jgi:membrane-bound lytic murein transglycosylase B
MMYTRIWLLAASLALGIGTGAVLAQPALDGAEIGNDAGLQLWLVDFRKRALDAGIKADVFDAAIKGISFDENAITRDRNQSEFTKTIWEYLKTATSDLRIENGKKALALHRAALEEIEAQYGVDKEVVVAVWGLESAYGTFRGGDSVLKSLASLAYDGRRQEFFEAELLEALRILQAGDTTPAQMKGSWAGAMGHTQFMPSSFQLYAVDFTKDGKRDIWGDDPRDALASTAAYLKHFGWIADQPWGVEVMLPDGFDYLLADRKVQRSPAEWAAVGVLNTSGEAVPDHGLASILLPGGSDGAAFMIFSNFEVIERYNTADAYVIGIGHLSDRIAGGAPIVQGWPTQDRSLTFDERIDLQTQLTALGFDTVKIDAKIGPLTINAVREFQLAQGLLPDGYASPRLLDRVRAAR